MAACEGLRGRARPARRSRPNAAAPLWSWNTLGGTLSGRIFGASGLQGEWKAHLASGARRSAAGAVSVEEDGSFNLRPSENVDPLSFGSSVQVIFSREQEEIRGWLVLRGFLSEMNRRGPLARSIGRQVAGFGTVTDMNLILEFVARDPEALVAAAERTGGGWPERALPRSHSSRVRSAPPVSMTWARHGVADRRRDTDRTTSSMPL